MCWLRETITSAEYLAGDYKKYRSILEGSGAQGRIRTTDTRIFNPLLYQLSYLGTLSMPLRKRRRTDERQVYRRYHPGCPAPNMCFFSWPA